MTDASTLAVNSVKLVGEALLPGTSLLIEGKFVEGAVHTALGLGARAVLGPVGCMIIAGDSFSKSVTGKNLWQHVPFPSRKAAVPALPEARPEEEPEGEKEKDPAPPAAKTAAGKA
jgi:hypothetical protein